MKFSVEEFKRTVEQKGITEALRIVDVEEIDDQPLRSMCRQYQRLHDDIMYRLENPNATLSFIQE